jgi:hypothetical protein
VILEMCEVGDVGDLHSWLRGILGEDLEWEVTSETLQILTKIRQNNIIQENSARVRI